MCLRYVVGITPVLPIFKKRFPEKGILKVTHRCHSHRTNFRPSVRQYKFDWPRHTRPALIRACISLSSCCEPLYFGRQEFLAVYIVTARPSGRAAQAVGLRPLACWDCGFESHREHGCLSVVSVVCCQVEVSATSWSLVQRSPTECGVSLCVI